jgi:hypothetical protein
MEQDLIKEERIFIFISKTGKHCKYLLLDKDCENDGREAKGLIVGYSVKFGKGYAGAMFKIKSTEKGEQITYPKVNIPVAIWKNSKDTTAWRAEQTRKDTEAQMEKLATDDKLKEAIQPLAKFMNRCRTRQERAAMLGTILSYLN